MIILGIESSCDDTSVALIDSSEKGPSATASPKASRAGHFVISEKTASQIEIHKKYGGVVPEVAGRMHAEKIVPLIEEVLKGNPSPDVIAVTSGPGLITGLLVGTEAAKTLSFAKNIPLISVNHIDGHIHSALIKNEKPDYEFPALCLVVSGGHTELVLMKDHGKYEILGKTKDDAAGECFDKVAKLLDLPYPGGPQISKLALSGRTDAIDFPRPMLEMDNFDFSFAGLKTSVLYWLRDNKLLPVILSEAKDPSAKKDSSAVPQNDISVNDLCASVEQAIVDVLVGKTLRAAKKYIPKTIILAGGVSANKKLRKTLEDRIKSDLPKTEFRMALPEYCMDNAAMIAVAGYFKARKKEHTDWREIKADPNWEIA